MTNEEMISDLSYTNKDFNSIYNELLDLTSKLTTKWDPALSNESDPGVLLLKLNAIIGDKNNYNIDKNILECFPLSVTQEGNARKLYSMLGYNMHWYRSATTTLGFQLRKTEGMDDLDYLSIDKFERVVDATKEIVFTTLEATKLYKNDLQGKKNVLAIQGTVLNYYIYHADSANNRLVTVNNLDDNRRLYFQEPMIAENGIFIADAQQGVSNPDNLDYSNELFDEPTWHRVDNLSSNTLGSKIYQFGVLPNTNTCYIEFPEDINQIIKDGIYIKYTTTKGEQGNIKAHTLALFYDNMVSDQQEANNINYLTLLNNNIKIYQETGTMNGSNPETLDEAYRNYRRTIGTFNNLVTARDYENYIYGLQEHGTPLISNVVVSDRTNDINYSNTVQTWSPSGNTKRTIFSQTGTGTSRADVLEPYDIVLYMLKACNFIYNRELYDETFTAQSANSVITDIDLNLDNIKSVQHNLLEITADDLPELYSETSGSTTEFYKLFDINNTFAINGTVITYNKITQIENEEIKNKIYNKLYNKYNARKLEFGRPIDYNGLIQTIKDSDARIKDVILDLPISKPLYQVCSGSGISFTIHTKRPDENNNNLNNTLIARMALAGNVQLFNFNDDFNFDFGQTNGTVVSATSDADYKYIKTITTQTELRLNSTSPLTIDKNEMLQITKPMLIPTIEYAQNVNYELVNIADGVITANIPYTLQTDESIKLTYVRNNVSGSSTITAGEIVMSNINLVNPTTVDTRVILPRLEGGEHIYVMAKNELELTTNAPYYFILNNENNTLNLPHDSSIILQENEYFIYTNQSTDSLAILGSGYQIKNIGSGDLEETAPLASLESINNNEITWKRVPGNVTLQITELEITTLGEGTEVKTSSGTSIVNNTLVNLTTDLKYKYTGMSDYATIHSDSETNIQSRLFINANQEDTQTLITYPATSTTPRRKQTVVFSLVNDVDGNDTPINSETLSNTSFLLNYPIRLSGGINLDAKILDSEGNLGYYLQCYKFTKGNFSNITNITRNGEGFVVINSNHTSLNLNYTFKKNKTYLIPIMLNLVTPGATVSFSNCVQYQSNDAASWQIETGTNPDTIQESFTLKVNTTNNVTNLVITTSGFNSDVDSVIIDKINIVEGYNTKEINSRDLNNPYTIDSTNGESIENTMKDILEQNSTAIQFDWTYRVPAIDKVLYPTTPTSYWNANHIYNKYTLPKIDFRNSMIRIDSQTI